MIQDPFMAAIRAAVEPLVQEIQGLRAEVSDLRETLADKVPDPERFWSYRDAAQKIGVSKNTIATWVFRGLVKKHDIDGKPTIPDSEIKTLLKNACRPFYSQAER